MATTEPMLDIVANLLSGTELTIGLLICEPISCLHDYALSVDQMRAVESARLVIQSGAGLEDFMGDALAACKNVVDASAGLPLLTGDDGEPDPHIWLAPENMIAMTRTVETALAAEYPQYAAQFAEKC